MLLRSDTCICIRTCRWRMYRGIIPPILVEAPKRAIKFAANDAYKPFFQNKVSLSFLSHARACVHFSCAHLPVAKTGSNKRFNFLICAHII